MEYQVTSVYLENTNFICPGDEAVLLQKNKYTNTAGDTVPFARSTQVYIDYHPYALVGSPLL